MHSLRSPYVRDQLALRTVPANDHAERAAGEFVLYWMQSTQRVEENWALRAATLAADRLGLPLVIHQGLDPTYEHASDRIHHFVIEGARETARRAAAAGLHYHFVLRRRVSDDRRVVDRLAARAALVVTDLFPTGGIAERTARFAGRAQCHVTQVDSFTVVPSGLFEKAQYSAPVMRPKLHRVRDHYLEPVEDRPPARGVTPALCGSLEIDPLDLDGADLAAEIARCEIDHAVPRSPVQPGAAAAAARLDRFVEDGLARYGERRREPGDDEGSSRLSPYLHFGHLSPAAVARQVLERGPAAEAGKFLDEMITWRELAFNFCRHDRQYASLRSCPAWARETMAAHVHDERPRLHTLAELEAGRSVDELWNAAQHELVATGMMHNATRQVWGKSVLLWSGRYTTALRRLLHLNNKYGLDGRDPSSYLNILWCFGKFDRPYPERLVWGKLRPMSLARAREKFDAARYIARWGPAAPGPPPGPDEGAAARRIAGAVSAEPGL